MPTPQKNKLPTQPQLCFTYFSKCKRSFRWPSKYAKMCFRPGSAPDSSPSRLGRGHPSPCSTQLDAFDSSILPPSALATRRLRASVWGKAFPHKIFPSSTAPDVDCVKLSGEDLSHYSNKIESFGLRKCP